MIIKLLNNFDQVKTFLNPIKDLVLCDDELKNFNNLYLESKFLGVYEQDNLIAILRWEYITGITACYHLYTAREIWGTRKIFKIIPKLDNWFKENTFIHKLTIYAPRCCEHVLRRSASLGWEIEGVLTSSVLWRNKIEDLVILSRFIRRQ